MSDQVKVNKKTFKVTVDGTEKEYAVVRPSLRVQQDGGLVYSKAFMDATRAGLPLTEEAEALLLPKIWNEEKQELANSYVKFLVDGEKKLLAGGNAGLTKKKARDLSVEMRMKRNELMSLTQERNRLYQNTAEAYAEQEKFDHFVSSCTTNEDGSRYFANVEDYLDRANDDPVAWHAQRNMMSLLYPVDVDAQKELPENKFLLKYGFCNDKLHLTADGKPCDIDGKPVNENGQLINEQGEPIDDDGSLLTDEGGYKIEFSEFLEDA